jgi:ABC-type transporter Mla subunit MlaD
MPEIPPLDGHERDAEKTGGPLLFVGSGVLLLALLLVGLAREQRWGQRHLNLRLQIQNASGVRVGQDVRISGLPVGQVRDISLRPDARVLVQLQVDEPYAALVGPGTVASQGQEGFVGDHYLVLSPDPQRPGTSLGNHPMQGRTVPYAQPVPIASMMQNLARTQADLQATLQHTNRITGNDLPLTLREARRSLQEMTGLGEALRQETQTTAPQLRQTLRSLQQETVATAPQLRQTLQQVSQTGRSASATSDQAEQLLRESRPVLLRTLTELQGISTTSRQLLQSLSRLLGIEGGDEKPGP